MLLAWLLYLLALGTCLAVAWSWFPKNRFWHWFLVLIGLALAVPWRAHPELDAGLAPAAMVTLFSLAFDLQTAIVSATAIGYWLLTFVLASAGVLVFRWWWQFRRRARQAIDEADES